MIFSLFQTCCGRLVPQSFRPHRTHATSVYNRFVGTRQQASPGIARYPFFWLTVVTLSCIATSPRSPPPVGRNCWPTWQAPTQQTHLSTRTPSCRVSASGQCPKSPSRTDETCYSTFQLSCLYDIRLIGWYLHILINSQRQIYITLRNTAAKSSNYSERISPWETYGNVIMWHLKNLWNIWYTYIELAVHSIPIGVRFTNCVTHAMCNTTS